MGMLIFSLSFFFFWVTAALQSIVLLASSYPYFKDNKAWCAVNCNKRQALGWPQRVQGGKDTKGLKVNWQFGAELTNKSVFCRARLPPTGWPEIWGRRPSRQLETKLSHLPRPKLGQLQMAAVTVMVLCKSFSSLHFSSARFRSCFSCDIWNEDRLNHNECKEILTRITSWHELS